jgi:hypothetical protein
MSVGRNLDPRPGAESLGAAIGCHSLPCRSKNSEVDGQVRQALNVIGKTAKTGIEMQHRDLNSALHHSKCPQKPWICSFEVPYLHECS